MYRKDPSLAQLDLFLTYINDLCDNINAKVRLFADDMILYLSIPSAADTLTYHLQHWPSASPARLTPTISNTGPQHPQHG